jgi:hypothetical protein
MMSNHRAQIVAGDHRLFVSECLYQPNHIANSAGLIAQPSRMR